jgi:hypothetical protein
VCLSACLDRPEANKDANADANKPDGKDAQDAEFKERK